MADISKIKLPNGTIYDVKDATARTDLANKLNVSLKGAAGGLAELDSSGKVPSSQLPSYVNYLGEITDVDNILNNPEYGDCPYEGIISSDVATSIGLSSDIDTEWSIKCFRATEGSGFQIAVPIYYNKEPPKYRIAAKYHLSGSYIISWGNWNNFSDGGNADTVDGKHASDFMQFLGDIRTGSLLDYISSLDKSGFLYCGSANCTDMPVDGTYFIVEVHCYATVKEVKATSFSTGAVYTNRYSGSSWLGWHGVADGGNADTLDGLHANEIASNPNLLINPDFKINQRGLASYSYTINGYTVDRWKINSNAKLTVNDGFVTFENTTEKGTVTLCQIVENPAAFSGKTVTLSFDYDLKTEGASITMQALANDSWTPPVPVNSTGRSVKSNVIALPENLTNLRIALIIHSTDSAPLAIVDVYGAKLELGEIATPIIPIDPAVELLKIQSMNDDGSSKLISNSNMPCIVNSQMVSNPNLLDNPDFKINQRGESVYSQSSKGPKMSIDRWAIFKHSSTETGDITLTPISSGGVVLNNQTDGKAAMYQRIENFSDLFGKQITFSASINGSILSLTATCTNATAQSGNVVYTDDKSAYLRIWVLLDTYIQFEIYLNAGASITVDWAKVEIGSVATPFCPPNPATELAKCQRYLWVVQNKNLTYLRSGVEIAWSENLIKYYLYSPAEFRQIPTLTYENICIGWIKNGSTQFIPTSIKVDQYSNIIRLSISIDSKSPLTIGEVYEIASTDTSYKLIFSAEL